MKGLFLNKIKTYLFCSNYKFSPYILAYLLSNIVDVSTIIHEIGHVYHYQKLQFLKYQDIYDIYKQDKEKADYYTEKFLSESGKFDYIATIDKYGIDREKMESCEVIKKYIKEIF